MRPITIAALIIVSGILLALPFRRTAREAEPVDDGILSGPQGTAFASAAASRFQESFDRPSDGEAIAWQPLPITVPQRPEVDFPPMPDSYYDLAIELEHPEPIRQRFDAGVFEHAAGPSGHEPLAERATARRVGYPSADRALREPDDAVEASMRHIGLPAEALIEDRFVFTPIAETAAKEKRNEADAGRGSLRAAPAAGSVQAKPAAPRERHFIREPD